MNQKTSGNAFLCRMASTSFWDKIAHNTAGDQGPEELTRLTVDATSERLRSSDHLLDIGCGTGVFTIELATHVDHATGMDFSKGMIEVARDRARRAGAKNIVFEQCKLDDPRYRSEQFDVVTAFNMLHYLTELESSFKRIHSILKPGGTFISSTACLGKRYSFLRMMLVISTWLGVVPKMHFFKPIQLEEAMRKAGFDVVDSDELSALPDHWIVAKKA